MCWDEKNGFTQNHALMFKHTAIIGAAEVLLQSLLYNSQTQSIDKKKDEPIPQIEKLPESGRKHTEEQEVMGLVA